MVFFDLVAALQTPLNMSYINRWWSTLYFRWQWPSLIIPSGMNVFKCSRVRHDWQGQFGQLTGPKKWVVEKPVVPLLLLLLPSHYCLIWLCYQQLEPTTFVLFFLLSVFEKDRERKLRERERERKREIGLYRVARLGVQDIYDGRRRSKHFVCFGHAAKFGKAFGIMDLVLVSLLCGRWNTLFNLPFGPFSAGKTEIYVPSCSNSLIYLFLWILWSH